MAASEINARWQADMGDGLIDPLTDPSTGFHQRLDEVFTSTEGSGSTEASQSLFEASGARLRLLRLADRIGQLALA